MRIERQPLLTVELLQFLLRRCLQLRLADLQFHQQDRTRGIVRRRQFVDPLHHDLDVAQALPGWRTAAWPCASSASSRDQDRPREIHRPSSGNGESRLANREPDRRRNRGWRSRIPRRRVVPNTEGRIFFLEQPAERSWRWRALILHFILLPDSVARRM